MSIFKRLRALFSARYLAKRSLDVRYALLEACLIGLFSALAAILLKQGIGWLGGWRIQLANRFGHGLVLPIAGLLLGLLADGSSNGSLQRRQVAAFLRLRQF